MNQDDTLRGFDSKWNTKEFSAMKFKFHQIHLYRKIFNKEPNITVFKTEYESVDGIFKKLELYQWHIPDKEYAIMLLHDT